VDLGAKGTALARATVTLTNHAPVAGQPPYVIGPFPGISRAGENLTYLSIYCARGCLLQRFLRDGAPDEIGSEEELGHPVFSTMVRLSSGRSQALEWTWTVEQAWSGNDGTGTYTLTFRGQTTVRPTRLVLDIRAPEGMFIRRTSPGMRFWGDRARWEGLAGYAMDFEVEFQRPSSLLPGGL